MCKFLIYLVYADFPHYGVCTGGLALQSTRVASILKAETKRGGDASHY
jgi:hypothetical protein